MYNLKYICLDRYCNWEFENLLLVGLIVVNVELKILFWEFCKMFFGVFIVDGSVIIDGLLELFIEFGFVIWFVLIIFIMKFISLFWVLWMWGICRIW